MSIGQKITVAVLAVIFIVLLVLTVIVFVGNGSSDNNGFVPPPYDDSALQGIPDVPDAMRFAQADIVGRYKVGLCGCSRYSNGELFLYFTSPEDNEVLLKVIVLDNNGEVLGESGLIRPGEYVPSVSISSVPDGKTLTIKVISYEFETYYSRGVAPLTIEFTVDG